MNPSRASSINASSHLVTSKHNAKCRRVPRIISRRLYSYRRKSTENRRISTSQNNHLRDKDFSPQLTDFSNLGETILNLLVKYPDRRSYSTDSDPLVEFRTEMNKSSYFNHGLMKRRYSVPETVMRKHKLQEILSKKNSDTKPKQEKSMKDESCQTEEMADYVRVKSVKKNSKRKRDGLRYFKKANSYCQYKSIAQKKKIRDKEDSSDCFDTAVPQINLPVLPIMKKSSSDVDVPKNSILVRQISAPSSNEEYDKIKGETPKFLYPLKIPALLDPDNKSSKNSVRQLSAPCEDKLFKQPQHCRILHPIRQLSAPSSSENEKKPDKLFESTKRVHIKNCKSMDQNTSGYNTICGSLDEYTTPRKKTPDSPKIPTIGEKDTKGNIFPITFHSESVFMHPCQEGIISHKEFHHISIQMISDNKTEQQKKQLDPKNDYFKTEIKLNVNDAKDSSENVENAGKSDKPEFTVSHPDTSRESKHEAFPSPSPMPQLQISEIETLPKNTLYQCQSPSPLVSPPMSEHEDCSVPTNYPFQGDKSNLKIEVDVGNVDIQSNLHDILLNHKPNTEPIKPKPEKYNSKAALNYLFQKLGDSYPRRYLLKEPVFVNRPQFGKYYSELPKPEGIEIPPKVLFNNQAYDILSGNLLPNEWSNMSNSKVTDNEHLSDSDISIPDSLEDFQQTKLKYNKYEKYDEKLARGDVSVKTNTKPSKTKGVAYFIPLLDSNKTKPIMPTKLRKKLYQRSENLSKHSSCSEAPKKSPRNKLIHKQIQTCLNTEDSLKKRRKKFAEAKEKKVDKHGPELDEKIKTILLSGLNENSSEKRLIEHPSKTLSQAVQTENIEPTMTEYMEMFKMTSPQTETHTEHAEFFNSDNLYEIILSEEEVGRINTNNFYRSFKKCRRIYYPNRADQFRQHEEKHQTSHIPTFSGYQKKLKEYKQQIKKQNTETQPNFSREESSSDLLPVPYPRIKKGREKLNSKNMSKIPGPRRFYQKFEAIPEEHSNSSDGVIDLNENVSGNSDENNESTPDLAEDFGNVDINENIKEEDIRNKNSFNHENEDDIFKAKENIEKKDNIIGSSQMEKNEMRSKGKDSLSIANEQEELITLSKGWINFYLLKGNSTEDNSASEDVEDENIALSETIQIPHQYTVHVHATPEVSPRTLSTFPGLYKSSKKSTKPEKSNNYTSLPEITAAQGKAKSAKPSLQNMLPKLHYSNDECDQQKGNFYTTAIEPIGLHRDITKTENSISTVTTSSNHSESPREDLPGRNLKKLQRYQRPHTYHSTRSNNKNQWSVTLRGSHNQRRDIEMQLSLKNSPEEFPDSWQLTLKSEGTEMSGTNNSKNNIDRSYLPHLNVNYKMLPSPMHQENFTANISENSGSNSTLSCSGKKYKLDTDLLMQNMVRLNSDLRLQIKKSDDDLTVKGSAITPERRPRVPTMSERDLTRMRLIRQSSADNRLM